MPSVGQELLNVPFAEMVSNLGMAIANAQTALDLNSIQVAQAMAGMPIDGTPTTIEFGGKQASLLELGFTPTFYQFVETVIEVKISITISSEQTSAGSSKVVSGRAGAFGLGGGLRVSSVNASYASKYQYQAEGSSLLRTKLVPVPIPALLEARIRDLLHEQASAGSSTSGGSSAGGASTSEANPA